MRTPFIPFLNSETLNTKAGFKLIYNTMLATKDFHKALNVIFGVRKHNLICAQDMIRILEAKYDKEKHDYIHAVLNNKLLESYNIHVCDEIIYNNRKYKVNSAIINSKNLMYVILTPIGFKYFSEKIPIECLV